MKIESLFHKKLLKSSLITILFLSKLSLWAAIPTVDALFRNSNNADLTGNLVKAKLIIREAKESETAGSAMSNETTASGSASVTSNASSLATTPYYFEFIFSVAEGRMEVLQLEFSRPSMESRSLKKVTYLPNLLKRIKEDDQIVSSSFYSLLMSLALNDSSGMMATISKILPGQQNNRQLLNEKKVELLKKYQSYLSAIKNDPSKEADLPNPMRPENPEEMETVKSILKENMYLTESSVKTVKSDDQFFWQISAEGLSALFYQDTHRLRAFSASLNSKSVIIDCGEYTLFDTIHEMPKIILITKVDENRKVEISINSLSNSTDKNKKFYDRYKEYKELEDKLLNPKGHRPIQEDIDRSLLENLIY
ncbi:MAG: hypothetical protein A2504_02225 [Bdellovibrionales bacterium RIFOXYD12_FULL_39_22]|nr:MAG: hypothetical protein A2385_12250 [Bdellovibrionales bacterium RIFOXYB1_FULL_39_21]OFZ41412.1 MAG: hypothetical protein A2485_01420 [Bdellovibrionales bacterium RIFOXYC12_FULL_39_17]OFZ45367.1 MAG: hypothetical protein A2404_13435 [Bdellovibrionales bacterium RIFOXYC1_FULL_39_130]OFZ73984.1 MAG: hypothetical protein A2451_03125 [Bdellovibrionales bacterium RIFOXYC2_FULL_39_8]OFZ74563.1 MAG: hypothetical protein A2560_12540 [Bdellovibrionales bacterium RIFOXYD1_FULL_39_84]OFZ92572.1 MAG: